MSSEERYGIPPQPGDACPLIDAVLAELTDVQSRMKRWEKIDNLDDAKDLLDQIDTVLFYRGDGITTLDRKIRKRCEEIRAWGQAWKDLAKEHVRLEITP